MIGRLRAQPQRPSIQGALGHCGIGDGHNVVKPENVGALFSRRARLTAHSEVVLRSSFNRRVHWEVSFASCDLRCVFGREAAEVEKCPSWGPVGDNDRRSTPILLKTHRVARFDHTAGWGGVSSKRVQTGEPKSTPHRRREQRTTSGRIHRLREARPVRPATPQLRRRKRYRFQRL